MIKTRFAPSPTGLITIGNARTALFAALLAKSQSGELLLRVEDTDEERSKEEYIEALGHDLTHLGICWDEGPELAGCGGGEAGPYRQSERAELYDTYYQALMSSGHAYPCFCTQEQLAMSRKAQMSAGIAPKYAGTCRGLTEEEINRKIDEGQSYTLRFKVPQNERVQFTDLVKGQQTFLSNDIGDFIIRRANKTASFMFCNAIDDALMGVTHVVRGEDHLTNTPRQMMILQSLSLPIPQYVHFSLILAASGKPLSKREGSKSLQQLEQEGVFPEAVVNYLARLGHKYEDQQHLLSFDELAESFNTECLSSSGAKFDPAQLAFWQKEAVMQLPVERLIDWVGESALESVPEDDKVLFIETIRPNIMYPSDVGPWLEMIYTDSLPYSDETIAVFNEAGRDFFEAAIQVFEDETLGFGDAANVIKERTGHKGKKLYQPLRLALTNHSHGPEMRGIVELLGPDGVLKRIQSVISLLS